MTSGLGVLDLIFLIGSMAICALIGLYFTNKNKSLDAYMLGDRQLSVVPVAISLMTSCLSGLTLLGASAEFYYQGPSYAFIVIPMLLCGPITAYTILPIFYRMNELSLYKYLHVRFGLLIKYIVTVVFIMQMIFYNSVVLYLPSMALTSILGVPKFYSILLIGLMCVLYSGIGGLKAVVWTDAFQAILMYSAVVVVGVMGTIDAGGFSEVFKQAKQYGRLKLEDFFTVDLTTRHTFWAIMLGSTVKHIYLVGVNQVQIQRALSLPTLRQGQWSFVFCSIFSALIIALASYLGAVLVAAYRSCDPFMAGQIPRRDAIIVHYVANRLSQVPGLRGIFVAGIFSATLSTLSSFANSMAALALEDFIRPAWNTFAQRQMSVRFSTYMAKILATSFGITCVLMAYVIDNANSRLLQATTTMFGAVGVPFLAAFAMGITTGFTNTAGVFSGFVVTLALGVYITIYQTFFKLPLEPQMPVFYNEQCAKVFNMTMSPNDLPSLLQNSGWDPDQSSVVRADVPFSIDQISYMTLPVIQFSLMFVIASIVSLITGGLKQVVNDEYLMPFARQNGPPKFCGISNANCGDSGKKYGNAGYDLSIGLESKLSSRINNENHNNDNRFHGSHVNKAFQVDELNP